MLAFCIFLSVLLIGAFALMYFGPTVQDFLPEGGDTRKMAVLLMGATRSGMRYLYSVCVHVVFFATKAGSTGFSWRWERRSGT